MNIVYRLAVATSQLCGRIFFGFRCIGAENVPKTGGCLLVMNHQSFLDPPLAGSSIPREVYTLARKSLLKSRLFRWLFPKLNVIVVDQDGPDSTALRRLITLLRNGSCVLLFPEGTRSPDGLIHEAQPGVGFLISKAKVPVVPMRIFGAHEALPPKGRLKLFQKIEIVVGQPLNLTSEEASHSGKALYEHIAKTVTAEIMAIKAPH